jgi:hypothetical protein
LGGKVTPGSGKRFPARTNKASGGLFEKIEGAVMDAESVKEELSALSQELNDVTEFLAGTSVKDARFGGLTGIFGAIWFLAEPQGKARANSIVISEQENGKIVGTEEVAAGFLAKLVASFPPELRKRFIAALVDLELLKTDESLEDFDQTGENQGD